MKESTEKAVGWTIHKGNTRSEKECWYQGSLLKQAALTPEKKQKNLQ